MNKRILSILLCLVMLAGLLPASVLAAGPSAPTVEGTVLYANGTALIFEGSSNQTRIFIDADRDGEKDDGEERFYPDAAKAEKGYNLYGWTIYGGSKGAYTGNTKLTMLGGGVQDVYGGCNNGTLTGNTEITILGNSTVKGSVYGGSNNTGKADGVIGSTSVTLGVDGKNKAAQVLGNVYGGGNQSSVCMDESKLGGNTTVNLFGTGARAGNVFGGGYGKYAVVEGNTNITSGGMIATTNAADVTVFGGIYGGGYDPSESDTAEEKSVYPTVAGKATIVMNGGWADKIVGAGTCAAYEVNGQSENLLPKLTVGEAQITVSGGTVRSGIDAASRLTTANHLRLTGGSIAGPILLGSGKKAMDGSGNSVYKTILDVSALLDEVTETEISSFQLALSGSYTYGTNGLVTDTQGKLYFYLPSCTAVASYLGSNSVANVPTDSVFSRFSFASNTIYANMNEIRLVAGTKPGCTNIVYDVDGDTELAQTELLKIGSTEPTAEGYDLSGYTIYLGFKNFGGAYTTALTMNGGCVSSVLLNAGGSASAYNVAAKINDGTILTNLSIGNTGSGVKTLEINGGSVDLNPSYNPVPSDKNGNDLYQSKLRLPGISSVTGVSDRLTLKKGGSAAAYGAASLYASNLGNLTFWLPMDEGAIAETPVKTTYTAVYMTEPEFTAYVDPAKSAPFVFRQTSETLSVLNDRAVKPTPDASSVSFTLTNSPIPAGSLALYAYDGGYVPCTSVKPEISGSTLKLSAVSGAIQSGAYYLTITGTDNANTTKYESEKLTLTVSDPITEIIGGCIYTNGRDVQVTADTKGVYACIDGDYDGVFEEDEFLMAEGSDKKLDVTGFSINAAGKTIYVTGGTLGTLTANKAVIDGGSIVSINAPYIQNGSGSSLYRAAITLGGVGKAARISAVDVSDYGLAGVRTDEAGRLYLWLPSSTLIQKVKASGSTYTGELLVSTDNLASATFTAQNVAAGGGGGSSEQTFSIRTGDGVSADMLKAAEGTVVTLTVKEGFTVTVKTESGETVSVKGSGASFTFVMPAQNVTVSAQAVVVDPTKDFLDLYPDGWYMDAVRFCVEKGYLRGVSQTSFDPDGATTRAQFVTVLYRWCGSPAVGKTSSFSDTKPGSWYSNAIDWAAENDIVLGYSDGRFGVNDAITREQIATILFRLSASYDLSAAEKTGRKLTDFSDSGAVHNYAREAMQFCLDNGILNGANGLLLPSETASRVQFATIIYNISKDAE